jgi:hypothetical protein
MSAAAVGHIGPLGNLTQQPADDKTYNGRNADHETVPEKLTNQDSSNTNYKTLDCAADFAWQTTSRRGLFSSLRDGAIDLVDCDSKN